MNRTDRQRTMRGARSMTEPRTEAPEELDDRWRLFRDEAVRHVGNPARIATVFDDHRARIETEAARQALEEVAERVRGLDGYPVFAEEGTPSVRGNLVDRAAVLALLSSKEEGS